MSAPDSAAQRDAAQSPSPTNPSAGRPPGIVAWSGMTHVGHVRPNNEDAFLALTFDGHDVRFLGKFGEASLCAGDFVFAVSDGMGGAKSGEFASRSTVDRITKLFPQTFRLAAAGMATGFSDVLNELIMAIHNDLLKLGYAYEECAGMGATLSLGWLTPEWLYFAHVGDSRIYHLPHDGGITQLTHDHTHVGWLRRQGRISEREARTHPRKNALQQVLGAGQQFVEPHIGAVAHRPGDRFLFCSDGLIDGLWDHHLEELIRTPPPERSNQTPAQCLVEEALARSGRDNTTAVIVEVREGAPGSRQ